MDISSVRGALCAKDKAEHVLDDIIKHSDSAARSPITLLLKCSG